MDGQADINLPELAATLVDISGSGVLFLFIQFTQPTVKNILGSNRDQEMTVLSETNNLSVIYCNIASRDNFNIR